MPNRYTLIGQLHINGKNESNSWKPLSKYLDRKITPFEQTKALIQARSKNSLVSLKRKINQYNKTNHTDFFIGKR